MSAASPDAPPEGRTHARPFTVPASAVDINGHVNNVTYVQWMQDLAIDHAAVSGGTAATHAAGCTWVARSHWIEYLSPAFAGDELLGLTWVETIRRVRSLRQYQFRRPSDQRLLARGETEWVFVDQATGHPRPIPDSVRACFPLAQTH